MSVPAIGISAIPHWSSQLRISSISGACSPLIWPASSTTRSSIPSLASSMSLISMACWWCGIMCWANMTSDWLCPSWAAGAGAADVVEPPLGDAGAAWSSPELPQAARVTPTIAAAATRTNVLGLMGFGWSITASSLSTPDVVLLALCSRFGQDASRGGVARAQPQVFDVVDRLVEQLRDMVVVEPVDDVAAGAVSGDQAQRAQQPQLV